MSACRIINNYSWLSFLLLIFLVAQSCIKTAQSNRRIDIERLLEQEMGLNTIVEGPLSMEEIEEREMKKIKKSSQAPQIPFGAQNESWKQLKDQYRKGDEIYFFSSSEWSPEGDDPHITGKEGYVLIRKGRIIDSVIAFHRD